MSEPVGKYIVFTTSKERNGTALLRDKLAELRPDQYVPARRLNEFIYQLLALRHEVRAVFALSDSHYMLATAITRLLRIRVPVVLGCYHPDQWKVTLDASYSPTRASVTAQMIRELTPGNVVCSSVAGARAVADLMHSAELPPIVPGPVVQPMVPVSAAPKVPGGLSLVTVSRFVPFKVVGIVALMQVIERLRDDGLEVTLDIYGEGDAQPLMAAYIAKSKHANALGLHGFLADEQFGVTVAKFDAFYGMGGAVARASMLGIPSIVSIQRCAEPICYGLMSAHDHKISPVFGDVDPAIAAVPIEAVLRSLVAATAQQLREIGDACRAATTVYGESETVAQLEKVLGRARRIEHRSMTISSLGAMRLETWMSRLRGKRALDA